jgi:hypothetical protein
MWTAFGADDEADGKRAAHPQRVPGAELRPAEATPLLRRRRLGHAAVSTMSLRSNPAGER